jgi:arabinan endo-1,5-alpha-L-arabinosidase
MRTTTNPGLKIVVAFLVLSSAAPLAQTQKSLLPDLQGDIRGVHDPSILKERGTYYVFSTRDGIKIRCSADLTHWKQCGEVFSQLPSWAVNDVPGLKGLWAPDVSFFNGRYHVYYSASTFGSNRSRIGLATNSTLNPASDGYRWVDEGEVIGSEASDDWNAIDPNVVLDAKGTPWLSFGSFWSGIKLRKLNPATGKLSSEDQKLYSIASRPRTKVLPGAIEAPAIYRRNGYYYLFVSFDFCCRGKDSTYNVRVGRSRQVTGPYVDRTGKSMMEGGGTIIVAGEGRWRGPGHCAVFRDNGGEKLVYHAYDAEMDGAPTLRIEPLVWDSEGWPAISSRSDRR